MALLCEIFQREITDLLLDAYYMVLKNMTDEQFKQSVKMVMENKTFHKLPLPAEILNCGNPDSIAKAEIALAKVEKAVDIYGHNYSIDFKDQVIHKVIERLGGWEWLTTQNRDDWKWIRKDFIRLFDIYAKMNPSQIDAPERLIGYAERMNEGNGIDPEQYKQMFITLGDEQKQIEGKERLAIAK
jgi:hypothetical protein